MIKILYISKIQTKCVSLGFWYGSFTFYLIYDTLLNYTHDHIRSHIRKGSSPKTRGSSTQRGDSVCSPMPGLLVKVPVTIGDKVKAGATLAIVEAMKMENELRAPREGIVKSINYKEGEQVDALKAIVELET